MNLGYLRRLDLRIAGRVSFGERGRLAVRIGYERETLERTANALDDLAQEPKLSGDARRVIAAGALALIRAGY